MPTFTACLLVILELLSFIASCHAEVRLTHDLLTVDIHDVSMADVLNDLRHHGNLNIVAFEETKIGNVRISKTFWNLPVEEGLDRLLSGWNYGINRDVTTGRISALYLVSRRTAASLRPEGPSSSSTISLPYPVDELRTQLSSLNEEHVDSENDEVYDDLLPEPNFPNGEELLN